MEWLENLKVKTMSSSLRTTIWDFRQDEAMKQIVGGDVVARLNDEETGAVVTHGHLLIAGKSIPLEEITECRCGDEGRSVTIGTSAGGIYVWGSDSKNLRRNIVKGRLDSSLEKR